MARVKCEAVVYESNGRGSLGHTRHCSFGAKWNVDGETLCTIHKNAELRLFYGLNISCEPLVPQLTEARRRKVVVDWVAVNGKLYRVVQNVNGYVVEFRYETDERTSVTSLFKSKRSALRWAEDWAGYIASKSA